MTEQNAASSARAWRGVTDADARAQVPYTDDNLVERALRNVRPRAGTPRWSAVEMAFGVGSTVAAHLCMSYGLNPDEILGERSR